MKAVRVTVFGFVGMIVLLFAAMFYVALMQSGNDGIAGFGFLLLFFGGLIWSLASLLGRKRLRVPFGITLFALTMTMVTLALTPA
jgi:hypothetical protein